MTNHDFEGLNEIGDGQDSPDYLRPCLYKEPDFFRSIKNTFSICNWNIRSIRKHLDNVKELISETDNFFNVICLTEIWNYGHTNISIEGFKPPVTQTRQLKNGGGLAIYVRKDVQFVELTNVKIMSEDIESIGVKVGNRIIINIYRPPKGNKDNFSKHIIEMANTYRHMNISICGDFNIDLRSNTNIYEDLLDLGLIPTIHKPTRVQNNIKTIIDNIMTNSSNHTGYIIPDSTSDHFITVKTEKYTAENVKPVHTWKRILSTQNLDNLKEHLEMTEWNQVLNEQDTQKAHDVFFRILDEAIENVIPLKKVKAPRNQCKRVSAALWKSMKHERKLYVKKCKNPSMENIKKHKEYKKILDKVKRNSRMNNIKERIEINKNNSKEIWKIIYENVNRKNSKEELSDRFKINDEIVEDEKKIANEFNEFFNTIGTKLANQIKEEKDFKQFLKNPRPKHFHFKQITADVIEKIGKNLKPKMSCGPDQLNSKVIKHILTAISKPLTHIINRSLDTGIVPQRLKESNIIPIFKCDDPTEINNHRPISLINAISKIYEKVVHFQLYEYFESNNILSDRQYGFRTNSSCEHAMFDLLNTLEEQKAKKKRSQT